MNNEPVAWMTETDGTNYFSEMPCKRDAIPLYTHPIEPAICVGYWDYMTGAFHKNITETQQKRIEAGFLKPVYTHPVKELHLSLQKTNDGELVAVTYTDDEHRIVEVLWEKPPAKTLTCSCGEPLALNTVHRKDSPCYVKEELIDEEIENIYWSLDSTGYDGCFSFIEFARAILRKAQEK